MLGVSIREIAFFPRCHEAAMLRLLFRYCAGLLQWPLVTPRERTTRMLRNLPWKTWSREDWARELSTAQMLPPVCQLYSEPADYYRLVRHSTLHLDVSLGGLTHQVLTARMGPGKQLAPSGWIILLPPFLGQGTPFERGWPSRMIDRWPKCFL